ncbi:Methyl-accepting chemotaxis protein [Edwardsiella anguillarum]|nr:hypothetical protein QY76_04865 [Edwardsiella sp. EA181011]RFT03394.1 hypothetical protein CGL57_11870 [Edwardsiella anguillarum]GAJ68525.1 methyl-accepting chemotaxis protein [Edwardsiella piscicida]BET82087.1 Methyl-accepting chemotaxis protein [Edwardsiella anguillarum]BET85516.1 Methyl-accepting chemotaxis protein [Edwardsiella anguillarum]
MAAPGVVEICATAGVVPLLASEPGVAASRVGADEGSAARRRAAVSAICPLQLRFRIKGYKYLLKLTQEMNNMETIML